MRRRRYSRVRRVAKWVLAAGAALTLTCWGLSARYELSFLAFDGRAAFGAGVGGGALTLERDDLPPAPNPGARPPLRMQTGWHLAPARRFTWWPWSWRVRGVTAVSVPLWIPAAALTVPAAWLFWLDHRARQQPGLCGRCGYERAGLADSAPCPECGRPHSGHTPDNPVVS